MGAPEKEYGEHFAEHFADSARAMQQTNVLLWNRNYSRDWRVVLAWGVVESVGKEGGWAHGLLRNNVQIDIKSRCARRVEHTSFA